MTWLADAIVIAAGALILGLMGGAIAYLVRDLLAHLRRDAPPDPKRIATQNGRPHGARVRIYPAEPPAE